MQMFDNMADEIFAKAGVDKAQHQDLWEQARDILAGKMAQLSVTMGLSYRRCEIFETQKQTIVDDLLKMKESGELRPYIPETVPPAADPAQSGS